MWSNLFLDVVTATLVLVIADALCFMHLQDVYKDHPPEHRREFAKDTRMLFGSVLHLWKITRRK